MSNSLVLLSGGFDSAVMFCDLVSNAQDGDNFYPVYVKYGNKNEAQEIACANELVKYLQKSFADFDVEMQIHRLTVAIMQGAGSPITNGTPHNMGKVFPKEYVPYRNAQFILSALSVLHLSRGVKIDRVYLATNFDDQKLMFPDCGKKFQELMTNLVSLYGDEPGDDCSIQIELPYQKISKAGIASMYKQKFEGSKTFPKLLEGECVFSGYTDGDPAPAIKASEESEEWLDPLNYPKPIKPYTGKEKEHPIASELTKQFGEQPSTSLMVKEHEPLIIRKFTQYGFPLYVGMICGANLDNLDAVVHGFLQPQKERIQQGGIQNMRNIVGELSAKITETYGLKIEGVAVVWYVDKMMVSSLYGDFMTHTSCRIEFFSLLQMSCHV